MEGAFMAATPVANLTTSTHHKLLLQKLCLLVRSELHRRHLETVALSSSGGCPRLLQIRLRGVVTGSGGTVLLKRRVVVTTLYTAVLSGRQQVDFLAM